MEQKNPHRSAAGASVLNLAAEAETHNTAGSHALPANDRARRKAWSEALARYLAAKAAEDAYDRDFWTPAYQRADGAIPDSIEKEMERLNILRDGAEDALMAVPSPDGAAFARKFLIARGDGREADFWDGLLEAEARRFVERGATGSDLTRGNFDFGRLDDISADLSIVRTLVDTRLDEVSSKAAVVGDSVNLLFGALIVLERADARFQSAYRDLLNIHPVTARG